jgi:hypothetical protein
LNMAHDLRITHGEKFLTVNVYFWRFLHYTLQ